ncbi:DUF2508 family protein [Paenibacillus faecalis]|uniref:DUF2508 family protein n=1 Tax=Paenibacillus faecalis TaxID=2079532 RepID=UPI000D0EADD7|nr:DUF2508 family protein [Paenibacillus faecalis]
MIWWNKSAKADQEPAITAEDQEKMWNVFLDVQKSQMEWERAHLMFQEAIGQDQIDYAIYVLEAAERKYQMNLKQAKELKLNSNHMREEIRKRQNGE